MDLFFALSGYLITSLLQNEYYGSGQICFGKFYARRALRLFPPLLICLAMANVLWAYAPDYNVGANRLFATLAGLFYFANLVPWKVLGMLTHLWTLSVEEHFYLVWPIILSAFLFQVPLRNRVLFLALTGFIIAAVRTFVHFKLTCGLFVIDSYTFTVCRMDAILMGSLLAMILPSNHVKTRRNVSIDWALAVLFCLLAAIVLFGGESNMYWRHGGFIFTDLLCLSIVAIAAKSPNQSVLANKILRWIGRRSYGIYLYHLPIFLTLVVFRRTYSPVNYLLVTALMFAVTIFVAALSYRFIERPILKYKKRYEVASEFVVAQQTSEAINRPSRI